MVNLLILGIGFDRYMSELDRLVAEGDHEGMQGDHEVMERLNAEYDVTITPPSVADRVGLSEARDR